jgi:hypothetical protein
MSSRRSTEGICLFKGVHHEALRGCSLLVQRQR